MILKTLGTLLTSRADWKIAMFWAPCLNGSFGYPLDSFAETTLDQGVLSETYMSQLEVSAGSQARQFISLTTALHPAFWSMDILLPPTEQFIGAPRSMPLKSTLTGS